MGKLLLPAPGPRLLRCLPTAAGEAETAPAGSWGRKRRRWGRPKRRGGRAQAEVGHGRAASLGREASPGGRRVGGEEVAVCVSHPVYPARNSSSRPAAGQGGGREGAQTSPCHLSPPPGAGTLGGHGLRPPVLPPQPTFSTSALSPFIYFLSSALKGISAPKGSPFSQKCPVRALHQHTRFRLVSPAKMLLKLRDSPGKLSFGKISFPIENPSTGGF